MPAMTTTSNHSTPNGPSPTDPLGVRIVTLLDFAGPLPLDTIARALRAEEEVVRTLIVWLMRTGHVKFSRNVFTCYETTGYWDPDRDGETSGYPTGPYSPKRHFRDDAEIQP